MSGADDTITIRSFRVCFRVERRLHRIDRFRVPLPYGMPLRGLGYGAAILLAVLLAQRLPLVGALLGQLHPVLRYGALPVGGGYLLTELRLDGRAGHAVAFSWLRFQLSPRRLVGLRAACAASGPVMLEPIVVAPDERGPRLRRGVVTGSGELIVRQPARLTPRRRTLRIHARDEAPRRRGTRIRLAPGERVVIA